MRYLLDSNILLRLARRSDPLRPPVRSALRTLRRRGDELCYTPQNLVEFWSVSTRPAAARGGLGLTPTETDRRLRLLVERFFTRLPDGPAVHAEWRRLVVAHAVSGVQVHDARLVAAMQAHGVTHLLTLNTGDFARYPGITAVHPQAV